MTLSKPNQGQLGWGPQLNADLDQLETEVQTEITRATAAEALLGAHTVTAGTGLTGGGAVTSNPVIAANFGQVAGTVMQGNDPRISAPINVVVTATTTVNLDFASHASVIFTTTLTAASTVITAINVPTVAMAIFEIVQDATGGRLVGTWFSGATAHWTGFSGAPTLSTGTGVKDAIFGWTTDGGVNWDLVLTAYSL